MYGALHFLSLGLLGQAGAQTEAPAWPEDRPGAIVRTPDWSDYRLYPLAARRKNQEGRVQAEILVGSDGKPQQCRIVATSFFAELDSGTCDLLMKMRFEPARNAAGNAVPSRFARRFNWRLTEAVKYASTVLVARVSLEEGRLRNCDAAEGAGPYATYWSSFVCTFLERITFKINGSGDASECNAVETRGFGTRGLNNLSPCGRLLSILWFEKAPQDTPQRQGTFETRVAF